MADTLHMRVRDLAFGSHRSRRSALGPYVCGCVITGVALLVRMLLRPYIGAQFPFATLFLAVTLTAWYGGSGPALLASVLGYFGAVILIMPRNHPFLPHSLAGCIGAGIYFCVILTIALFSEAQYNAHAAAEASAREARKQEAAARQREARIAAILEAALDAIITMDHQGRIVEFNPAAERIFGLLRNEAMGKELAESIIPPILREAHRKGLAHYLDTGEGRVLNKRIEFMALHADGTEFPVELAIIRIPGDGPPLFSAHIHDITHRRKSETRQRFLAEASDLLASSLDYQTTLQSVARLAVPHLADWCVVHLLNDNATLQLVTAMHVDPAKVETARESSRRYPPRKDEQGGLAAVARTGKSEWIEDITDDMLRSTAQDDDHYRMLVTAGMKSFLCAPLVARGRILGTLTFIGGESGHRYNAEILPMAEELARRAGIAVDNMLLFQAERERSDQLTLAIQEIHHRVKNNLQAVSALLEMQIDSDTACLPVEAVYDSLSQIKTIALVHDLLARDKPMGQVNIAEVLTNLANLLASGMRSSEQSLAIRVTAEPVWMHTKAATSLALAVNELLTNAAKHNSLPGRKEESDHAIEVNLQKRGGTVLVVVQDHGPGFPPDFDPVTDAHIGLQLVLTLVEHDLRGAVTFSTTAGESDGKPAGGGRVEICFAEQSVPD